MKKSKPSGSAGGPTAAHPPAEPLKHKAKEDKDQTEEEAIKDEDLKAPVGLLMKFLRALMDKDFQLAVKLCQMILIYEPDNPEASEFLPLIQKKLLGEQDTEKSGEEDDEEEGDDDDDDDEDDNTDSGNDDDDDDSEKQNQVNRHRPCPPAHVSP